MNSTLLREFGKLQNNIWQSRQEATEDFPGIPCHLGISSSARNKHCRADSRSGVLEVGVRFSARQVAVLVHSTVVWCSADLSRLKKGGRFRLISDA